MTYHDECPKCFGPRINPACKDCGHDVEDALREENARLRTCAARDAALAEIAHRERDEARATKDMHKERQAEAWAEVARLEGLILDCEDDAPGSAGKLKREARRIRAQREEGSDDRGRGGLVPDWDCCGTAPASRAGRDHVQLEAQVSKPIHPIRKMQTALGKAPFQEALAIARHVKPLLEELERGIRSYYPAGPNQRRASKLLAAWKEPIR